MNTQLKVSHTLNRYPHQATFNPLACAFEMKLKVKNLDTVTLLKCNDSFTSEVTAYIEELYCKRPVIGEEKEILLYDNLLNTLAVLRTKITQSSNVAFQVISSIGQVQGLYGELDLEEKVVEPKTNNILTYTTFKDFTVFDDYLGVPVQSLSNEHIDLNVSFWEYQSASFCLTVTKDQYEQIKDYKNATSNEIITKVDNIEYQDIQWLVKKFEVEDLLMFIEYHLDISREQLFKLKYETNRRVFQKTSDKDLNRLYASYNGKDSVIFTDKII